MLTVLASDPLDTAVKDTVQRARPRVPSPVLVLHTYSFPSGHAMASVIGVGALLIAGRRVWRGAARTALLVLGALVVLLVGAARVVLRVHYPSDVVGGWLLGSAWLAATTAAFRAWHHELAAPGGEPS